MLIAATGFLGNRASLMLDVVFLAMFLVLPAMGWSIQLAKQKRVELHKKVQLVLAGGLLVTIVAFEVDLRLYGWTQYAEDSPYYASGVVHWALGIHLLFAIPTPILWIVVTTGALRYFPVPAKPGKHSRFHLNWGKMAALGMLLTAITGWVFYYLGFMAT